MKPNRTRERDHNMSPRRRSLSDFLREPNHLAPMRPPSAVNSGQGPARMMMMTIFQQPDGRAGGGAARIAGSEAEGRKRRCNMMWRRRRCRPTLDPLIVVCLGALSTAAALANESNRKEPGKQASNMFHFQPQQQAQLSFTISLRLPRC